jgi:hypothetical protein
MGLLGLTEVSPGSFVGVSGANAVLLTSQGKANIFRQTPAAEGVTSVKVVQAINGRLCGAGVASQGGKNVDLNLSFGFNCSPQSYPNPYVSIFSIPTPDGLLYGTQYGPPAADSFVRMSLDGALSVVHAFSAQEGYPSYVPILGPDATSTVLRK